MAFWSSDRGAVIINNPSDTIIGRILLPVKAHRLTQKYGESFWGYRTEI
jgi:hypothetical protein